MEAQASIASDSAVKWSPSSEASDIVKSIMRCCIRANIVLGRSNHSRGNYAERIWNNLIKFSIKGLYPVNAKPRSGSGRSLLQDSPACRTKPDSVLVLVPAAFRRAGRATTAAAAGAPLGLPSSPPASVNCRTDESRGLAPELQQAIREDRAAVTGPIALAWCRRTAVTNIDDRVARWKPTRSDCRSVRCDRHGDPPGPGGSRRRRRLMVNHRKRGGPRTPT